MWSCETEAQPASRASSCSSSGTPVVAHLTAACQRKKASSILSISAAARSSVALLLSGARLSPPAANWKVMQARSCREGRACSREQGVGGWAASWLDHKAPSLEIHTWVARAIACTYPLAGCCDPLPACLAGRGRIGEDAPRFMRQVTPQLVHRHLQLNSAAQATAGRVEGGLQ